MVTPHRATVFNSTDGRVFATVLESVFMEARTGTGLEREGAKSRSGARLFIPFGVQAKDAFTGEPRRYLPPKEYRAAEDRHGFWTLEAEGQGSGTETWFVKGVCPENSGYGSLRARRDGVFRVAAVAARDHGTEALRHWEVEGV